MNLGHWLFFLGWALASIGVYAMLVAHGRREKAAQAGATRIPTEAEA